MSAKNVPSMVVHVRRFPDMIHSRLVPDIVCRLNAFTARDFHVNERSVKGVPTNHVVRYYIKNIVGILRNVNDVSERDVLVRRSLRPRRGSPIEYQACCRRRALGVSGDPGWVYVATVTPSNKPAVELTTDRDTLSLLQTRDPEEPEGIDLHHSFISHANWFHAYRVSGESLRRLISKVLTKLSSTPHGWRGSRHVHFFPETAIYRGMITVLARQINKILWRDAGCLKPFPLITVTGGDKQWDHNVNHTMTQLVSMADYMVKQCQWLLSQDPHVQARNLEECEARIERCAGEIETLSPAIEAGARMRERLASIDAIKAVLKERATHQRIGGILFTHR